MTTITAAVVARVATGWSEQWSEGDDQSKGSQDIVDNCGNVAADSNSMEGLGSVPLLLWGRITQRKTLQQK